jgi:hypothetical protein
MADKVAGFRAAGLLVVSAQPCQGPFPILTGRGMVILGGHIFLIFKYWRMSGNDVTASSPRAAVAAAMITAVMYPSVRIACLLFFS